VDVAKQKMLSGKTPKSIGNGVQVATLVVLCKKRSLPTTVLKAGKMKVMTKAELVQQLNNWVSPG